MYLGGRDRHFRPYIVMKPAVLFDSGCDDKEAIAAVLAFFTWIFQHTLKNEHVENVVNLVSHEGMTLWGMKWALMKNMMPILQSLNAGKSRGFYVVNAIPFFAMIFKVASVFIDANTLAKLNVTTANSSELITSMIAPEQLEEQFGGIAPNRKDGDFWPPKLLSDKFGNEDAVVMTNQESK